jgi:antitoxin (DNA-binding transcriptional repressor) of toxin-antitoxin stability system
MAMTASQLRQNIYRLLDEVLENGTPLEIERRGRILRIVPDARASKLDRLEPHPDYIIGDPDDLIHMDWSEYWDPGDFWNVNGDAAGGRESGAC